ncbi:MAG TPA: glycosyltransferase [Ktedonobacteraceae bacterium]|nr:glycosyltransferase [Ktedonobacteraceae bacterium]
MLETLQLRKGEPQENVVTVQPQYHREPAQSRRVPLINGRFALFGQVLRFALVGGLNTVVDLLILNGLLWLFPTSSTVMLLAYSAFAFSIGAINSFLFNKYWTFEQRQKTTRKELLRFVATTLCGIVWSSIILWLASNLLHPVLVNAIVWANASKVFAIGGTALISYLGMRLWVFVSKGHAEQTTSRRLATIPLEDRILPVMQERAASGEYQQHLVGRRHDKPLVGHSLSVILPAYNEEQVIASTIFDVLAVLTGWHMDFEVLVVNDGSTDRTGAIVAAIAGTYPQVRLITHPINQGYGAALASGFAAASKDLTFFMDSDGQFDIRDLQQFFPYIDEYEAVIGYRIDRQDSWMRKLNAWGWKLLIHTVLGVRVRDVDCAFKLLHTAFLRQHPLETRGAMINAELLYKLTRAGASYREIGVHHRPRLAGRATGANPVVILRALRDLFTYAWKWGVGARLEFSHDSPIENQ